MAGSSEARIKCLLFEANTDREKNPGLARMGKISPACSPPQKKEALPPPGFPWEKHQLVITAVHTVYLHLENKIGLRFLIWFLDLASLRHCCCCCCPTEASQPK